MISLSLPLSLLIVSNKNYNNNYYSNKNYDYIKTTTSTAATTTTTSTMCTEVVLSSLSERYYHRLHIDPTTLDNEPTIKKLQLLREAHLLYIPFENIAQHGARSCYYNDNNNDNAKDTNTDTNIDNQQDSYKQRQIIDIQTVATNVLDKNRGGFCLELNTLFAYWLQTELQYPIHFVSAYVARDDPTDTNSTNQTYYNKRKLFANDATHIIPYCTTIDDNYQQQYMIDIAFGESCIDPLLYPSLNTIQITSENMICKFIRTSDIQYQYNTNTNTNNNNDTLQNHVNNDQNDDDNVENNINNNGEYVMLLWYLNNEWVPRLRWNYNDSIMPTCTTTNNQKSVLVPVLQQVQQYQCMYDRVHDISSGFTQKLIITKVSKTQKISFAGTKLKIAGPPRFPIVPTSFFHIPQKQDTTNITITNIEQEQIQVQQLEQDESDTKIVVPTEVIPVTVEYYDNDDTIRQLLLDIFGIPICETLSMTFVSSKSSTANPLLWDQF